MIKHLFLNTQHSIITAKLSPNLKIKEIVKIPLRIKSHRGHYGSFGDPSNLLKSSDEYYYSEWNNKFVEGENDWIIFGYDQLYIPRHIAVTNFVSARALNTFRIFIGDGNEWHLFNPEIIKVDKCDSQSDEPQTFSIEGIDSEIIAKKQFKQIKVEFIKNHGDNYPFVSQFVIKEIKIFGSLY